MSTTTQKKQYQFVYKGVEYDATDYAQNHPGGLTFLDNMKAVTKDFTEYFRALHSDRAEKILKSFPIVSIKDPSKTGEEYMEIYMKMEPFFQPLWAIEILLCLLVTSLWFIGCTAEYSALSIACFALTQILIGWIGHSGAHNRNENLNLFSRIQSCLLGGLSLSWWNPKHNMHHMFTNISKFDEDIQHEYKVYFYPFLYLKWRFDSMVSAIKTGNYLDVALITCNYISLYIYRANLMNWLISELIGGLYSAYLLIGNHEREKRFESNPNMPFIHHQVVTSRNYREENILWLLIMGGMQYQTEHHLFPQVPFYRLPSVKQTIKMQLAKLGETVIYGPVV